MRQANAAPVSASVKANVAPERGARSSGRAVIAGGGGAEASMLQRYVAGALSLPAASTAVALKLCSPSASPSTCAHEAPAPSRRQFRRVPASASDSSKRASVAAVSAAGATTIDGGG